MARPFEGIRIIDITHVLAGPFAAYQLGLMGADVIKVEHPDDPDQSRDSGSDNDLNHAGMGTGFLTQGSNKRAITLNLKTEQGREILKKLVATADVLVENYRPGAFEALGLGYEAMREINPKLIYASFSAFGQGGPRECRQHDGRALLLSHPSHVVRDRGVRQHAGDQDLLALEDAHGAVSLSSDPCPGRHRPG